MKGSHNLHHALLTIFIIILMSGCVSKSKHQELVDSFNSLKEEKAAAETSCDENIDQMTRKLAEIQGQNNELAACCEELNEKYSVFQEKNAEAQRLQTLIDQLQQDLAGQQAVVSQLEDALKIEVVDKLMFKSGSARVTVTGSKILSQIAPVLISEVDKEIVVVGHTDDLPPSKTLAEKYPSNWELSAARAASIVHILTWQHKIDPARVVIQGAAHYHPVSVYDGNKKEYRKTNRVVEIILKPKTL